jgi:hypothetical protein
MRVAYTKKGGWGGAGRGQGRKRLLGFNARMWIGAECETRWDDLARSRAIERSFASRRRQASRSSRFIIEQKPGTDPVLRLQELYDQLATIPIAKRRTRRAEINVLICEIRDLKVAMGGRFISAPLKRPKGSDRHRVLIDVAAVATTRYRVPVLPSVADRCWKEYRRKLLRPSELR